MLEPGSSPLWSPSQQRRDRSNLGRYMGWLDQHRGLSFSSYHALWRWSVEDLEGFWSSIGEYFSVRWHQPPGEILRGTEMPGARWFPGATLNYAEHALDQNHANPAVLAVDEEGRHTHLSYHELRHQTAAAAAGLRRLGIRKGDRVAALLPNITESLIGFLASASLGAVWTACSPEVGVPSVVSRFAQVEPRVLLATDGYRFKGASHACLEKVSEIHSRLPSLLATVLVPSLGEPGIPDIPGVLSWSELVAESGELLFETVSFDHPLWVLYSSGTTGPPKAIVQGHGGILLEHLKELHLHLDLSPRDRFFWFTTTGWMMWNFLVGGLLVGATVVLYEGSPGYPDASALWRMASQHGITYFGTSAPYIEACLKKGLAPGQEYDLEPLASIGSTGSPLAPRGFDWVYGSVKHDLLLGSLSGGTDVCTAFVGPCPLLPVYPGEIQCRQLGAAVESYDSHGQPGLDRVGELVLTRPMPSMPVFFWNDPGGTRYRESYFETFPGVWRHGDWVSITNRGGCIIHGRSDATINRGGVRAGTSEFYAVVEAVPEILDSLVVDTEGEGQEDVLWLFVVTRSDIALDAELENRLRQVIRQQISPRHLPDRIVRIQAVPRTHSGKKLEVPVKRILSGRPVSQVISPEAVANPETLAFFSDLAADPGRGDRAL